MFQSPDLAQCPIGLVSCLGRIAEVGFNRLIWRNALQVYATGEDRRRIRFNRLIWRNALQEIIEFNQYKKFSFNRLIWRNALQGALESS